MVFELTSMLEPVDELRLARIMRPRTGDERVGRSARVVGDMVVGEDGGDGGRGAGAVVGAALGGGGGVGGSEWGQGGGSGGLWDVGGDTGGARQGYWESAYLRWDPGY